MRVAIIGSGLQCRRRAPVIRDWPGAELVVVDSLHLEHAQRAAREYGCTASADWRKVVTREDIDAVVICTPPHVHADICLAALGAGKHVLCEKPLARTEAEAVAMVAGARSAGRVLKCGFNHRHHPAIQEAKQRFDAGGVGRPLFARCRYGICGRPGYEKEWRADPNQAAGGHFLEQGLHAIDLFRWFLGPISESVGLTQREFFKEQPLDEGGMALFRARSGATASLHSTITQWKNLFSFEVYGANGYLTVEGLGGGYGPETLTVGIREFEGPFRSEVLEFRGPDSSWKEEWAEFVAAVSGHREPLGNGEDGLRALRIALATYDAERTGRIMQVDG